MYLRAMSPKRAWYQHMEVGVGCGGGDRGRKRRRRGEGERVLVDVERAETLSRSWDSSERSSSTSRDGSGCVTPETPGEPAAMMLSPSSASSSSIFVSPKEAKTIRTLPGRRWRNSSRRSFASASAASSCCMRRRSCVGL